jgi:hypothetical protein
MTSKIVAEGHKAFNEPKGATAEGERANHVVYLALHFFCA